DQLAKNALEKSKVSFVPERFEKIFTNWMEGIEDWCISRQLWWGHRIPVYYRNDEIYCGENHPDGDGWIQDADVLDTWFSSALWPFSTLGWPENTADFKRYYPNDVMVTGYDIIFFWVARMIFQAIEFTGQTPFKECLIHGLIRDKDGRKMSKSLGNGVDPIEVVDQYGADALRYFITTNSSPGQDLRYEEEKVLSSWNFINKIWNISRYTIMNTEDVIGKELILEPKKFSFPDRWIITRLNRLIDSVDYFFDHYEFGEAAKLIYNFTWNDFASWYVEMAKLSDTVTTKSVLIYVLENTIKLLHPFMPFVTEEIFQKLSPNSLSIMISDWPKNNGMLYPETEEKEWFFELIKGVRTVRNDYQVSWTKPIDLFIQTDKENIAFLKENDQYIRKFLNPNHLIIAETIEKKDETISLIFANASIFIPLGSLVNVNEEIKRLNDQLVSLEKEIERCTKMLSNPNFTAKAPQAKIDEEKNKLQKYEENYKEVTYRLKELTE
ncbi:MAG: class I tRNA ligase family protein, partial [Candidatus Izemoplasmatales bacterium]|nr:class I tRNA ligase family protein [Candidatus Izemoplasmatales bacterium]